MDGIFSSDFQDISIGNTISLSIWEMELVPEFLNFFPDLPPPFLLKYGRWNLCTNFPPLLLNFCLHLYYWFLVRFSACHFQSSIGIIWMKIYVLSRWKCQLCMYAFYFNSCKVFSIEIFTKSFVLSRWKCKCMYVHCTWESPYFPRTTHIDRKDPM